MYSTQESCAVQKDFLMRTFPEGDKISNRLLVPEGVLIHQNGVYYDVLRAIDGQLEVYIDQAGGDLGLLYLRYRQKLRKVGELLPAGDVLIFSSWDRIM